MKKTIKIAGLLFPILGPAVFASAQAIAETFPLTIWSANKTNCSEIFPGAFIGCKAVTAADKIRVRPEQVKKTDVKLLKSLVFTSMIVYEAPCQGSTISFAQGLTFENFVHPIPFDQPVGFVQTNVKYNGDEKTDAEMSADEIAKTPAFTYSRASDSGDIVSACRMTIISKDTFPMAESLETLGEYVASLIETNTQLIEALRQLGNISDIANVRRAVDAAIIELQSDFDILNRDVNTWTSKKKRKEDDLKNPAKASQWDDIREEIATLEQQIQTGNSKLADLTVLLTNLKTGRDRLGVTCQVGADGTTTACQSLIKEIGTPIRNQLLKTNTELGKISTWLQEEITVFQGKAIEVKNRFGAIDQALSDLNIQIGQAIDQLKEIPETPTPAK